MQNDYATSEGSKSEKMNGEVAYSDFSWLPWLVPRSADAVVHERCLRESKCPVQRVRHYRLVATESVWRGEDLRLRS